MKCAPADEIQSRSGRGARNDARAAKSGPGLRLVSAEYPRRGRGAAATRPRQLSAPHKKYDAGDLYDVSTFKHPGGSIVKFLTNNGDATEAFNEFHGRSKKAQKMLKALPKKPADEATLKARGCNGRADLTAGYAKLRAELEAEGRFDPNAGEIAFGRRADVPWRRVAATPRSRRASSAETATPHAACSVETATPRSRRGAFREDGGRGAAAAATWMFRRDESWRRPRPGTRIVRGDCVAAPPRLRREYSAEIASRRRRG